ncbi:MAG: phospholipase D-like domain-containing protein, partial [Candidatus Thorarchaeota archaeon]
MKHIGFLPVILLAILLISPSLMLVDMGPSATVPNQTFNTSQVSWQELTRAMNVTTFVSPDGSKDALWNLLRSAKESIFVEIFGINNPYILDLIHQLRAERPSLKMKFLIGWNSIGYVDPNKYVANNLTLLGIPVRWTNSADFTYAHQKFIIIDNKTTVVHSGNWAKTSFPEVGKKANREWSIAMTDTQVTAVYRAVFDYDWFRGST